MSKEENTEIAQRAVDIITEKPIEVRIPNPPRTCKEKMKYLIGRHPKEIVYQIKPIKVGTAIRIAELVKQIPSELITKIFKAENDSLLSDYIPALADHMDTLVEFVAIGLTNERKLPADSLKQLIHDEFDMALLLEVAKVIVYQLRIELFLSTIASVRGRA